MTSPIPLQDPLGPFPPTLICSVLRNRRPPQTLLFSDLRFPEIASNVLILASAIQAVCAVSSSNTSHRPNLANSQKPSLSSHLLLKCKLKLGSCKGGVINLEYLEVRKEISQILHPMDYIVFISYLYSRNLFSSPYFIVLRRFSVFLDYDIIFSKRKLFKTTPTKQGREK